MLSATRRSLANRSDSRGDAANDEDDDGCGCAEVVGSRGRPSEPELVLLLAGLAS